MQAILAAIIAGAGSFIVFGLISSLVHRWRHGIGRRYLWGVLVISVLAAIYEYLNYLGR